MNLLKKTTDFVGQRIKAGGGGPLLIIMLSFAAALVTGLITPQPMIGDEVTHYYMLCEQARDLSQPNFKAVIPVGYAEAVERWYPHSCGWHYLGAVVHRLSDGSFRAVQFYHALFWLQLLCACYLMAFLRKGRQKDSLWLYLIVMATLPAAILFSVAFYQDIPVAAQFVSTFVALMSGHWIIATVFMLFALVIKINAFVWLPAFFLMLAYSVWNSVGFKQPEAGVYRKIAHTCCALLAALLLTGITAYGLQWSLSRYAQADFYPVKAVERLLKNIRTVVMARPVVSSEVLTTPGEQQTAGADAVITEQPEPAAERKIYDVIANHPGDLRFAKNWLIYFGGVVWLVILMGVIARLLPSVTAEQSLRQCFLRRGWIWVAGLGYLLPALYALKTAPDARFFLPALPFLMLPFCEWAAQSRWKKLILPMIAVVAVIQAGAVYWKTYSLRHVPAGVYEAIAFLKADMPDPPRVFMYPEGNYRLFPTDHEWYLSYGLRDFWKGDNDLRLEMLKRHSVGAVVVKKHLIAPLDEQMHNLGIYPPEFVEDLRKDDRFVNVLENRDVIIFFIVMTKPDFFREVK